MRERFLEIWLKLPVLVRALIAGFFVAYVGNTLGVLPLIGNIKFHPEVPWALPATILLMALFWFYFVGHGWPRATRPAREDATRTKYLPLPVWRAAILPILLSTVAVASLRLLLPSLAPMEPPHIPLEPTHYRLTTLIGLLLSLAISAAVAEEVGFRGYMQKPLEDRYGVVIALTVTGFAFWYAHSNKVSLTHLPFHLLASVLLGLTAYLTRSLVPSIVGHALGDAALQPAYLFHWPNIVWTALAAKPVWASRTSASVGDKMLLTLRAMNPAHVFAPGEFHTLAVLAWVFLLSLSFAALAFIPLVRVSARAARPLLRE